MPEKTSKIAIEQALWVIQTATLGARLEENNGFFHLELKLSFVGFMKHGTAL